ncbi:hypothetical protein [Pseudoalteromonas luteoviolacea]|uniref:hypothetical protein n=1 Tax=Pseudoalteromonas luteoviolacea TaxID=43657 RepID=UPI001B35B570|nr:hypothetical protein [Pseudoalteromonas luteoviolacea]MBQ4839787.1 hypothetical protein [Pseudoalteromonas luteoviolacea]
MDNEYLYQSVWLRNNLNTVENISDLEVLLKMRNDVEQLHTALQKKLAQKSSSREFPAL